MFDLETLSTDKCVPYGVGLHILGEISDNFHRDIIN